ncbi:MAG: DUF711 family protein [Planctomycetes bacterium]|nr:DUF711 family protein [Planctomycetota bacterium]
MKVRSLTLGFDWQGQDKSQIENSINEFFEKAVGLFAKNDIEVRTNRLVLPPFILKDSIDNENINQVISWLSEFCENNGIRWFCVPFSTFDQQMREINSIALEIVKRHKNAFINFIVTENGQINHQALLDTGRFIKSVSRLSNNGYDNFRVGASFNCKPNGPFFPFTYHSGNDGFSIALELVPLFIDVVERNRGQDIEQIRSRLLEEIAPELSRVNEIGIEIEQATKMSYKGIDASLAPYPDCDDNSVAGLIELLGVDVFGSYGTIFLTSFLTNTIKKLVAKSEIRSVGFNGVMYSLLEDTRLGTNNSSKEFSIDSLLSYSTVCGCGIDMVPVPGDIFEEEIASIMLDIAAISTVLKKPLGVRLLPIPTKHAYEFTEFSYDFLYNTRIQKARNHTCFSEFMDVAEPFAYLQK